MYGQTVKEIWKDLPHRVLALIWKLISIQGLAVGLATWLVWEKRIDPYAWVVVIVSVVFGRAGLDVVEKLKK